MKKVLSVLFVFIFCAIWAGCNSAPSDPAVSQCEEAIDAIGILDPTYNVYFGEYEIDTVGMSRFERADQTFNQLSEDQQKKVRNSNLLEEQRETYENLKKTLPDLIMWSEIYAHVKLETEIKAQISCDKQSRSTFKVISTNVSVYNPLDGSLDWPDENIGDYIDRTTGEITVRCDVDYTYTNSTGGPEDSSLDMRYKCVYDFEEQTVTIIESERLNKPGLWW